MTISGALSNALSGMTASARSADVAASNIANAMTEGYGVREIILTPRMIGDEGGVTVVGLRRVVDQVVLSDRRRSEAGLANAEASAAFFERIQNAVGLPSDAGSLSDRVARLEASLAEATRAPESAAHLLRVGDDLSGLTTHLGTLGDAVQLERARADQEISTAVDELNETLLRLQDVNARIGRHRVLDNDVSAMLDERQKLVDRVSTFIPVTELDRGNGKIALMAPGGTMLLDGKASTLGFTRNAVITAHMSHAAGTLSGLTVNGREVDVSGPDSPIRDGELAALFAIRDDHAVTVQSQLDGFARDLLERFADPAVDPTRPPGDPGLLTDNGAVFDPLNEVGLSQRLTLNPLVDPEVGGQVWRIRDGLGAIAPGPEGQSSGLLRLAGALAAYQSPQSAAFAGGERTASGLASDIVSHVGGVLRKADTDASYARTQFDTLKEMELLGGVDTDAEMQRLLLIEQAYAANARVVQVADDMLSWLMRIGA